jgi:hypothetical protein
MTDREPLDLDALPRCESCGHPLTCGQPGRHYSCAPAP